MDFLLELLGIAAGAKTTKVGFLYVKRHGLPGPNRVRTYLTEWDKQPTKPRTERGPVCEVCKEREGEEQVWLMRSRSFTGYAISPRWNDPPQLREPHWACSDCVEDHLREARISFYENHDLEVGLRYFESKLKELFFPPDPSIMENWRKYVESRSQEVAQAKLLKDEKERQALEARSTAQVDLVKLAEEQGRGSGPRFPEREYLIPEPRKLPGKIVIPPASPRLAASETRSMNFGFRGKSSMFGSGKIEYVQKMSYDHEAVRKG